jgi:hypothetical protein
MVELWTAPAPRGSGPQISLRFLRALQRGDELAAASELSAWGRTLLAQAGMSAIHRVMRDVVRHAELDRTGMCSRARSLSANAAVVSCGSRHVVVHLGDWITPGVLISAEHPRHDVYRGPHTHAFTTLDLLTLR